MSLKEMDAFFRDPQSTFISEMKIEELRKNHLMRLMKPGDFKKGQSLDQNIIGFEIRNPDIATKVRSIPRGILERNEARRVLSSLQPGTGSSSDVPNLRLRYEFRLFLVKKAKQMTSAISSAVEAVKIKVLGDPTIARETLADLRRHQRAAEMFAAASIKAKTPANANPLTVEEQADLRREKRAASMFASTRPPQTEDTTVTIKRQFKPKPVKTMRTRGVHL
jgi:hypothetical protein